MMEAPLVLTQSFWEPQALHIHSSFLHLNRLEAVFRIQHADL